MRQAVVSIRDEDGSVLGVEGLLSAFHDAGLEDIEVLSCEGARGVVRATTVSEIETEQLDEVPAVVWYERVAERGSTTSYVVEFDVREADVGLGACDDGLLHCEAIDVSDDGFTVDVAGPQDAISSTVAEYEEAGGSVRLESLRDYRRPDRPMDALTDRQREVVEVAFEEGYFEVPRRASTDDLAAVLNLDSSTVAEHLQRAQRNLVSSVLPRPA